MKAHCWVCAALATVSCNIGRALPRDRTAFETRRAHCYKRDRTSQAKEGDGRHGAGATCVKCPDGATHLGVPEDPKRLIVVGDRVLITPEEGEERTNVGLYL